jgi:hypothetical protein
MKTLLPVAALAALAALAGCGTAPTAAEKAAMTRALEASVPTCMSERECDIKMLAARDWIIKNAGMKLQFIQPGYLETYSPPSGSQLLAVKVLREPWGKGWQITSRIWCESLYGCGAPVEPVALHFNNTVAAAYKAP